MKTCMPTTSTTMMSASVIVRSRSGLAAAHTIRAGTVRITSSETSGQTR